MIRNLISSLNLFMVCLYSLLPMPTLSISLNNSFPALMIVLPEVLTQQSSPPSTLLGHAEPGMSCQSLFSNITSWICVVVESHIHPHLKITYNGTRIEFKKKKKRSSNVWVLYQKILNWLVIFSLGIGEKILKHSNGDIKNPWQHRDEQIPHSNSSECMIQRARSVWY